MLCHLSCVILALVLLGPVVRHPGWWLWTPEAEFSDLAVTHWSNAHFTRRMLWEQGQFPLWRSAIMSGTPFAANPLTGVYYPPNWVFLFLPFLSLEVGFNLSALAHLWLAGAAMYALARRGLGTSAWGASVAAVTYEASPKLLAHLGAGHVGWVQAWGWLPVVVLSWVKVCEYVGRHPGKLASPQAGMWAAVSAGTLALQFFADVRMAAYTLAAVMTLALAFAIRSSQFAIRYLLCTICLCITFLGLTACQWLPTVMLLPETTRASMTLHDAAAWSLPWRYLAGTLLANHGGFHEWMTYIGTSAMVLAMWGIGFSWRKREERWLTGWLVGLLVGATWFSLGENGGLFQVLWRVVPGLSLLRVPPRAWVLVVLATAVLAGLGVERVRRRGGSRLKPQGQAFLMGVGVFPPLLVVGYWMVVGTPPLNLVMFGVAIPLAVALTGLGAQVFRLEARGSWRLAVKPEAVLGMAAVLLVAVDLLVVDTTLIEARAPTQVFADGRAAAEWLAAQPGRFRVYSPSLSIPQHVAELYGLELADGVDPLQLRVYADYLTRAAGLQPGGYSVTLPPLVEGEHVHTALAGVVPDAGMMGQLGVRYVAAAFPIDHHAWRSVGQFGKVFIYENEKARPLPETKGAGIIMLADGTVLFQYQPQAVYTGWAVSGVTVGVLVVGWLVGRVRR